MPSQFGAKSAAVDTAVGHHSISRFAVRGAATTITIVLAATGCTPATTHLAGADPANPAANVAGVGYRSTVAPYISVRPATPAPWGTRNDSVAPQPKSGREQP